MKMVAITSSSVAAEVAALRFSEGSTRAVTDTVAALLADVRSRGDAALVDATARFDWPEATVAGLPVTAAEIEAAYRETEPAMIAALEIARDNCTFFHRHELRADWEENGPQGQRLGMRYLPAERAGLYVPGGLGAYASTVIMNVVPAQVAGVKELVICTPPGHDGRVNASVLAAARLLGVDRVFRVGGAQAIAAMAYGTESVPRVDVICGPGNAYVMEAKRQVYGTVGIDSLAGPSEVLVVADGTTRPEWVAADLLAQEEHGMGAMGVLMAESQDLCQEVRAAVERLRLSAGAGVRGGAPASGASGAIEDEASSGRSPGDAIFEATDAGGLSGGPAADAFSAARPGLVAFYPGPGEDFLELVATVVDEYAPEHLEIQVADHRGLLARVRFAGAVFIGGRTPTAFGDYIAGSNHVLPTGGSARFSSPLSVDTFVRTSSLVEMSAEAVRMLTPPLARIAASEGFDFHRLSAELRAAEEEAPA